MPKVFRQQNNYIVAFSFVGLIVVSQLLVVNMGYQVPTYFLMLLSLFCGIILWGMIDVSCTIEEDQLTSKVGPFIQKLKISELDKVLVVQRRRAGNRKATTIVKLFNRDGKRKLDFSPADLRKKMIENAERIPHSLWLEVSSACRLTGARRQKRQDKNGRTGITRACTKGFASGNEGIK